MESMMGYLTTNLVIYIAGFFVGRFAKIDVVFGVTVPRHLNDDGMIDEFRKDYKRIYGITAGFLLMAVIIANIYVEELSWLFDGYVFIWFILTVYLYIVFHKKVKVVVKEVKEASINQNLTKPKKRIISASLDNRENEVKNIYRFFIPSFILVFISLIGTIIFYDQIPSVIPIHYNALGQIDQFADKSLLSVYGILIIEGLLIILLYMTCLVSIKYSRRRIDPRKPETSRLQIMIANKRLVIYIAMMSFLLCITFVTLHLGMFKSVQLNSGLLLIASFAPTVIIILGLIIYFATTGIYGDRVKIDLDEVEKDVESGIDEDEGWFLGLFYYNKKDTSVFVSKRFGGGLTVNLATLGGKLFIVVILVIIVGGIVISIN